MEPVVLLLDSDWMDDEEEDAHIRVHDMHPLAKVPFDKIL
jgi:hypothetical protein